MSRQQAKRGNGNNRLRELLEELDRLLNPSRPIPVRVPAPVRKR